MKKTSKKFLYTILCLGLLASLSTSAASFAALENFGCGSYSCYNGCPYYSNVGGFDYNSITKEYLETNKEDYIDKWDCYPGGQFFVYLSNKTVFSVTLHKGKFIIEYAKSLNDQTILIPETLFGIPVKVTANTWFYPPIEIRC